MPTYKIERWDPVIPRGHTQPLPMIYVTPDDVLLKLAKDNDYNVIVTISDTGKLYDTKPIPAVIDSSAYYPEFRPNFYNNSKLLVLTLMCEWIGYGQLGSVCIHGFTGPDSVKLQFKDYEVPKPLPWNAGETGVLHNSEPEPQPEPVLESFTKPTPDQNSCSLTHNEISLILLGIVLFLAVFVIYSRGRK
jgi:hypothetical protein